MLHLFFRILFFTLNCCFRSLRRFDGVEALHMRTQVGFRQQQQQGASQSSAEEEIVEIILPDENNLLQEKIYVAVGKDMRESVNAVKWALQSLSNRDETLIILLHVQLPLRFMPTPIGRIPVTQANQGAVKAYLRDKQKELNTRMRKYLDICTEAQVNAEILFAEKDNVAKGIVEVISEKGIHKLIMGTTSAGGSISRRMRMRSRGIADYVQKHAIDCCEVSIVCKEKLVLQRQGSQVDDDMLRKQQPETCTVSARASSGGDQHISINEAPSGIPVKNRDSTSTWSDEVNDSHRWSTIDTDLSYSEFAQSSEIHSDGVQPQPPGEYKDGFADVETLKEQLTQALKVAENVMIDLQKETAKRKKAEAAVVKANYRIKELESAFKETVKEKEEATFFLRIAEEKHNEFNRQREKSLTKKINEFSCEKNEIVLQLQAEQQKLAAMAEQNHRILQEKEIQIKLLQDCLHSRPPFETLPSTSSSSRNLEFSEYTFDEIKEATSNFSEHFKIGEGGYGIVYKGEIRQTTVAIKILRENSLQGLKEFEREIDILRGARHPHLVRLVGACFEQGCVIYEYMSNGSLAEYLSSSKCRRPLPWQARIRIAAEICSALQYLHSFKPDPIVHRDLKPENILLDENYMSKISDFGLARTLPLGSQSESEPKGTFGYMDPEYLTGGQYSTKSDVYSVGIVILQLLTGKAAVGLAKEVKRSLECKNLEQVLDPTAGDWPFAEASQLANLALQFTDPVRKKRPDLQPNVMEMLNHLRNIAVPLPAYSCRPVEDGHKGVQNSDEIRVPEFLLCPILKEMMWDPYVATDGFTYEKEAILKWFDCGKDTSPMTNKKIMDKNLIPNLSLRSTIRQWEERGHLY